MKMLKILDGIFQTPGLNAKKNLLRSVDSPFLRNVVNYTYDPYKNYHIRQFPPIPSTGANELTPGVFRFLDFCNNQSAFSHSIRDTYIRYANSLTIDSQIVLNRILSRDLRMGLNVKSFNSVWPGVIPTFDVMLAQKVDWKRVTFPCYSSVKLDGVRALFQKGNFYTRSGKIIPGLGVLQKELENINSIDGELIVPGENFQTGCGNIRSLGETPDALYCMFEIPKSTMSFPYRLDALQGLRTKHTRIVQHRIVQNVTEAEDHYLLCRKFGYEGTVIKPIEYDYQQKRSYDWMKLKAIESEDLPMVCVYEGTGKYENLMGGIIVKRGNVHVRVGGGFTDEERETIWLNPKKYEGVKAEILYQEVTPDGSLRHPRFLKWRHDKS